jgi:hypothetical protein
MLTMTLEQGQQVFLNALTGNNFSNESIRAYNTDITQFVDFPIGGFSPPEGRLARGFKPPAFSRFLFQSAVKSAESF